MITATDLESLLGPMLDRIGDPDLRDRVVRAWLLGCERGGWTSVDQLHAMPFTLLTPTRGVSFVEHTLAVTAGALALARAQQEHYRELPYTIDHDWLVAGGLLHDVGKLLEITRTEGGGYRKSHQGRCARHPFSGAILASEVGLPDEIVNMVACHAKEGEGRPQRIETILIHQADFATFNPMVYLEGGKLIGEEE